MDSINSKRDGGASGPLLASVIVLLVIAASGYGLYFETVSNSKTVTLTSVSLSTVTSTVNSTVTSTTSVVVIASGTATTSQSSSTTSSSASSTALVFQGTLVIIPEGIAKNQSLDFTPSTIRVVIGVNNTVTWLNQDPLSQHTVVTESTPTGAQSFAAILKTGETFTTTFAVAGTYQYYCMWHPGWMKGMIVVVNP